MLRYMEYLYLIGSVLLRQVQSRAFYLQRFAQQIIKRTYCVII